MLQTLEQRPGFYAVGHQRGGIQRAGFIMRINTVAIALHRMIERLSGNPVIPVIKNQAFGNLNDLQRIICP